MKNFEQLAQAYEQGEAAKANDQSVGMNPYSPDSELELYEAWLDGFGDRDDV